MSLWRNEASKRLPELHRVIASPDVDNPMSLWIELQYKFLELCSQENPPLDLLRRIWGYAKWCMDHGHEDVGTAAALGFCEHLLDKEATKRLLPRIMSREDYLSIRELLLSRHSEEEFARGLRLFEKGNNSGKL